MQFVFEEQEGHKAAVGVFLLQVDMADPILVAHGTGLRDWLCSLSLSFTSVDIGQADLIIVIFSHHLSQIHKSIIIISRSFANTY